MGSVKSPDSLMAKLRFKPVNVGSIPIMGLGIASLVNCYSVSGLAAPRDSLKIGTARHLGRNQAEVRRKGLNGRD